ncbi:hypothetical protein LCGC14_1263210 [marine sediment metagenome]|uniref:Uncharacterized protein n=1 Tax=marine sediment metagenome TaxID=412755 RepID=A0A0F9NGW8_9ZZZZ
MEKSFKVIEYNHFARDSLTTVFYQIFHNQNISDSNICVIVDGVLCVEHECDWCDDLRKRCRSRRVY